MRAFTVVLIFLCLATALHAQVVDEASFRGSLLLNNRREPYTLKVLYHPDHWRGMADIDRSVEKILLAIGGHKIIFPPAALTGLYNVTEPSAVYTSGVIQSHGLFTIEGGGGEKSFKATFEFSANRLLSREMRYTRVDAPDGPPKIIRFDNAGRKARISD